MRDLPQREKYGEGCYRRCIVLDAAVGSVRGELADDFHHFAVSLRHDGRTAGRLEGEAVRVPWTTCPGALEPLRRMEGAPITRTLADLTAHTRARAQCTHLHDLACLAIAQAARFAEGAAPRRRYDATLPDRTDGRTRATLARDGETILEWQLQKSRITDASLDAFTGLELGGIGLVRLIHRELDPDIAEAAWILQRAVFIGAGRRHDFEAMPAASVFAQVVGAACHTFDPARVDDAHRNRGTLRDFTRAPERILERTEPGRLRAVSPFDE